METNWQWKGASTPHSGDLIHIIYNDKIQKKSHLPRNM
jgi:hypothetical protein